jgi:type II secretory ATPase GspE/PulE/Tfp pilus assembly ATPase PilB-like protein
MSSGEDIRRTIARHFVDPVIDAPVEDFAAELESPDSHQDAEADENLSAEADTALVRLVNKMIADARAAGVSDVHIEANGGRSPVRIRFRKDGALSEYLMLPQHYRRSLVSRIKVMAALDISEKRRGQDGKIRFQQAGAAPLELRVATIPTLDGREDIVLRLLSSGAPIPLDELGLRAELRNSVDRLAQKPYGIFIVCGPTGSGKTTTLHSILGHINTADLKIWTAEDPVEIQQEGLRQVQVNPKAGWTFAAAMRSFLRADPDVIMVGEMRDTETAQIAVEASLTGHTVFSTLHTNSSVDTVVRLLDMGVQPFNFADSLLGVLAQRLVRRLCAACKVAEAVDEERALALATEYCADTPLEPRALLAEWAGRYGPPQLWSAPGCEACHGTGYRGRIGVHELFVNTPAIAPLIHRRADAHELRGIAIPAGMRTLKQDGMNKCLQGLTDLNEVRGNCA